ncbi:MAG: CHASE3 domain-containing protein [Flavipsychrobacter sp.]
MRLSFTKKLTLFYMAIVAALLLVAYLAYDYTQDNQADNQSVNHSYQILRRVTRVRILSNDNTLHCGYYVVTGNPQLLQYIYDEKDSVNRTLNELIALTEDNPAQQERIRSLKVSVLQGIKYTDKIIAAYQTSGQLVAMRIYAMGKSGKVDYIIRDKVAEIESIERKLLYRSKAEFKKGEARFVQLAVILIISVFIVLTLMFGITYRQIRLRRRAEAEVKSINEWLEERVKEKTATIRQQSERFRHLMDNMIEGMQIIDKDWKYIYLNDVAIAQSKMTREQLVGKSIADVYPNFKDSVLYAVMKLCMETGNPTRLDNEFTYPDGSIGCFDLSIEPVEEGLLILSMDISERKAREMERQRRIDEAKEILNKISHDIRQPVSSIVGVSHLLDEKILTTEELQQVTASMKEAIVSLDVHTRELSDYVTKLRRRG